MTKSEAGRLGGRTTFEKYGSDHMRRIGKEGAKKFYEKYELHPVGTSWFAIVERATGREVATRRS